VRHLYLLRHAKSSWELAGQLDWERGLLTRGIDDSKLIAGYMFRNNISPDLVICSSARRTKQTLAAVREAIPRDTAVAVTDDAYQASTADLYELVRAAKPSAKSVLLIGHNPSIHDFAVDLAADGPDIERMAAKFPTAALAEFSFDGEWNDLATDGATLDAFTRPKTLR
jgi:phosphohistidine phosphatase